MPLERVLVLCRANRCRSPLFEEMLRAEFTRSGAPVRVSSAGFLEAGRAAASGSQEEAQRRGLDLGAHRSRRVGPADLRSADLVLAMGLEHLRDAVALEPGCWPRAHTVRGFLERARATGPLEGVPDAQRLARWHEGRRAADLLRAGAADDVADPVGGPPAAFAAMGREFDDLVPRVAALVAGHPA